MVGRGTLVLPLSIFLVIKATAAIDVCLLLGTCVTIGNHNNNQNHNNNDRSDPGPPAVFVDGDWLEPQGSNLGHIYHIGHSAPAMNWFQADLYCEQRGGFLAEPKTHQEHEFLRGQARRRGNTNWWLGLREAESCQCRDLGGGGGASFEASMDLASLRNQHGGYVKATCPSGYQALCSGHAWKWAFSGQRLAGYSQWNTASGEPNGNNEHCVIMWNKGDFRWGDWPCRLSTDVGHAFKPICQKAKEDFSDEDDTDYGVDDGEDDYKEDDYGDDYTGGEIDDYRQPKESLEQVARCLDQNVQYQFRKRGRIEVIQGVSAHTECQRQCARNSNCQYWTWRGDKKANKKCHLSKSNGLKQVFRKPKNKAYAGSMSAGGGNCRQALRKTLDSDLTRMEDWCVEFNARYRGGSQLRFVNNVATADKCKELCVSTQGCEYYVWRGDVKQKRCYLRHQPDLGRTQRKVGAVSGSVLGNCRSVSLDDMTTCSCAGKGGNDGGQSAEDGLELVGGGIIDVRANQALQQCSGRRQVRRCVKSSSSSPVTTSTPRPDKVNADGEICAEYDVQYNGGGQLKRLNNVASADVCRARCIQQDGCRFWTWKGSSRRQSCILIRSDRYTPVVKKGSISGSLEGRCATLALSQLTKCECIDFELTDEELDLVGTGLISVRIVNGAVDPGQCPENQGLRCYSKDALVSVRARGQFDLRSGSRAGGSAGKENSNDDAIVFGK